MWCGGQHSSREPRNSVDTLADCVTYLWPGNCMQRVVATWGRERASVRSQYRTSWWYVCLVQRRLFGLFVNTAPSGARAAIFTLEYLSLLQHLHIWWAEYGAQWSLRHVRDHTTLVFLINRAKLSHNCYHAVSESVSQYWAGCNRETLLWGFVSVLYAERTWFEFGSGACNPDMFLCFPQSFRSNA